MPNCKEQVYSNDYYDFIMPYGEAYGIAGSPCIQPIEEGYDILYYPKETLPPLNLADYSYLEIPKCFGLMDQSALEASGIIPLQIQPTLALKGNGVLLGFVDTGIDYTNPLFTFADKSSRIFRIWDQTILDGTPPAGIWYGAEYRKEEIDEALSLEQPYDLVPSRDENGHGTCLAALAAGGQDVAGDFLGAAPESYLAVVKLKEAKQYLKEFFFVKEGEVVFQENDIMLAIAYLDALAREKNLPLVICLGLGSANGSRAGNSHLSTLLNRICIRRQRFAVVATGNEAGARHHFWGQLKKGQEYEEVEVNVEAEGLGFFMELWADAPLLLEVSVFSPTGEEMGRVFLREGKTALHEFLFEQTMVSVDYRMEARETGSMLAFFRFQNPRKGLWKLFVYPKNEMEGRFDIYLPLKQFTQGEVSFVRSNPERTLTIPSSAAQVISVGAYQATNQSLYGSSGRGYSATGMVKPDFVAPGVQIYAPNQRGNYVRWTGTSMAAAITAGAIAQVAQWAFVERHAIAMSNADMKNMLIRGCQTPPLQELPNASYGYGFLDVYQAFLRLRA